MNTASVFLGLSLGSAVFAAAKATQQSVRMWKRHKTLTAYIISTFSVPIPTDCGEKLVNFVTDRFSPPVVWLHWAANISLGLINWLYMWGSIVPR